MAMPVADSTRGKGFWPNITTRIALGRVKSSVRKVYGGWRTSNSKFFSKGTTLDGPGAGLE